MTKISGFRPLCVNNLEAPLEILSLQVFSGTGTMVFKPLAELGVENLTTIATGVNSGEILAGTTRVPKPLRKLAPHLVGRKLDQIGFPFRYLEFLTLGEKGHDHLFPINVRVSLGRKTGDILAGLGAGSINIYVLGDTETVLGQVQIPDIFADLVLKGMESALKGLGVDLLTSRINYLGIPKKN